LAYCLLSIALVGIFETRFRRHVCYSSHPTVAEFETFTYQIGPVVEVDVHSAPMPAALQKFERTSTE